MTNKEEYKKTKITTIYDTCQSKSLERQPVTLK